MPACVLSTLIDEIDCYVHSLATLTLVDVEKIIVRDLEGGKVI